MKKRWTGNGAYRKIQLEKIANTTQFSYTSEDEFGLINLLKDFRLFKKGIRKTIVNMVRDKTASYESDFYVFDYHYKIYHDEDVLNFSQTVFLHNRKN